VSFTRWVLVEKIAHDTALIDFPSIDASHPGIDVVVDHIQLEAAFSDCDAVVDRDKITL